VNELPLQELFTRLREAGLPLGIDEYQLVLRSMQAGFGMSDKGALKRLCQTLWIKSAEEKQLFEYQFERVMSSEGVILNSKTQSEQRKIFHVVRYGIMGILSVGIILSVVSSSKELNQTENQKLQLPRLLNAEKEVAQIEQSNTNRNQTNWIFWSWLSVITLSSGYGGYILFRQVFQQKARPRIGHTTSVPEPTPSSSASNVPSKLTQTIKDEVQVAQALLQTTSRQEEIADSRFILTNEYFPVTERQMKQIWRYLRRPVREGAATELDVEATVNQIGRKGLLLEPVLVPRRVNQADLLLLIDQDGSMVPFHTLSHRLAETALRGGRLGKAGIYYFHNCPLDYLYHDSNHQEAEFVSDVVTYACSERTAVLIFSDAGAARGGYNEERYELTKEFLAQLRQRVRYITWLNPMPKKRWQKTTAGEIAHLVPMFELSRRGMQDVIGVLRGRPTKFEGQKK
jgi:uncharacterized protein with von Willebrand factor type A (vWA) domain